MNERAGFRSLQIFTPWRLACLLVVLLSGLFYIPSLNGLAIWDDHALIGGKGIGGGKSLAACFTQPFLLHYFRPLVSVSFYVDHHLWGSGPFFYHQTNILIHVLTTAICLLLLNAAFRSRLIALVGGLAFALQPAQVSTVAWIGGRTDSLCTLWIALFAWTLIRGAQTSGRTRSAWIAASTVSFGLALLTKEQVIGALLLVPFAFRCFAPTASRFAWREGWKFWTPFILTVMGFIAAWFAFYPSPYKPVMHDMPAQFALAGRTITYYAALLLLPSEQWMHQLSVGSLERLGVWPIVMGYAILAAALLMLARFTRRSPACAWFLAFVLVTLLPICNLLPLPSLVVAPYRAGVSGLGIAALLGCLFAYGAGRGIERWFLTWSVPARVLPDAGADEAAYCARQDAPLESPGESLLSHLPRPPFRVVSRSAFAANARLAAGCAFLLWCGALTWMGVSRWHDERTIFSTIVRCDPESIVARYNLSTALLQQHQERPAIQQIETMMTLLYGSNAWRKRDTALNALRDNPRILDRVRENQGNAIEPKTWLAALYAQLGFARFSCKDRAGARHEFEIGAAIDRVNDDVNLGLGQLAYDAEDYPRAASYLRLTLAARPNRAEAHMLMGHTLAAQKKWREAKIELRRWAELQPWSGQAYIEVAQTQSRLGDYSGARASLEYALTHAICNVQEVRARLSDLHGRAAQFLLSF